MSAMATKNGSGTDPRQPRAARPAGHQAGLLTGSRRAVTGMQRPRSRSWGLVTLAALLVVGSGLAVVAWGLSAGAKDSVLAVGVPVAEGQIIERSDLVSSSVAGVEGTVLVEEIDTVVGKTAAADLVAGQILTEPMFTAAAVPGEGQSLIGLALDPTRVPGAGLDAGDQVDVIAVPGGTDVGAGIDLTTLDIPEVLGAGAQIYDVGGQSTAGGQVTVTLIVSADDAARIAAYSTQNRVAIVETAPSPAGAPGAAGAPVTDDPAAAEPSGAVEDGGE